MTTIHKLSAEALLPELDLFTVPPTQKSIERSYETQHRPISSIENNNFIEFHIPTSKDEYILLHESYLYFKMKIILSKIDATKKEEIAIKADDWMDIKPSNNLLHSMIKQIELKIGNKEVTSTANTYAYRAYLENLLGFGGDAKNSHLGCALWTDTVEERREYFQPSAATTDQSTSNVVELYGRLHTDLTFQGKALLGGCDLIVKLILNSPEFVFECAENMSVQMKIMDASLFIHRLQANQKLVVAHNKALANAPAKYPITRIDVKHVPVAAGSMDAVLDNIIIGQLPRRLFVGCVGNSALNGSKTENPFYFSHYNISNAVCYLDGIQYPSNPYQPDFEKNLYVREYSGLFQAMNMNSTESTINIKRKDYIKGNTIFGFNFAPDLSNGCDLVGHVNPLKRGTLRLHLRFKKALTEVIDVILFCEYDNIIEIDSERNVSCDFK